MNGNFYPKHAKYTIPVLYQSIIDKLYSYIKKSIYMCFSFSADKLLLCGNPKSRWQMCGFCLPVFRSRCAKRKQSMMCMTCSSILLHEWRMSKSIRLEAKVCCQVWYTRSRVIWHVYNKTEVAYINVTPVITSTQISSLSYLNIDSFSAGQHTACLTDQEGSKIDKYLPCQSESLTHQEG